MMEAFSSVSEQVFTEETLVSFHDDGVNQLVTSQDGFDPWLVRMHNRFAEISFVDAVAISCSIACLSLFLNSFVVVFYRKMKTSTRPYILLLAALDCIFVLVVLLPNPVIALMYDSPAKTVLKTLRYYAATSLFTLYLNPTFYLALDRFIAVFFPHKFKVLAPKMRPLKVGLFVM